MRKSRRSLFFSSLLTWLLVSHVQADTEASATVSAFHNSLIIVMKTGRFEDRLPILEAAVSKQFAIDTIARISLGRRTWQSLEVPVQETFEAQLQQLIVSTYASRFDNYSGQVFNILAEEPITEDRHRVRSEIVTTDETVSLDYQLQLSDGTWRIYDVAANGVSDLSLKRSNYAALLREGGLEAVLADIAQEISEVIPGPQ